MTRPPCSAETSGPISVFRVEAGADFNFFGMLGDAGNDLVNISFSIIKREPAQQHWPLLKKIGQHTAIAASRLPNVLENDVGDLPPSSRLTFLRLLAAARTMILRDFRRTSEGDLVNIIVGGQSGARRFAGSRKRC